VVAVTIVKVAAVNESTLHETRMYRYGSAKFLMIVTVADKHRAESDTKTDERDCDSRVVEDGWCSDGYRQSDAEHDCRIGPGCVKTHPCTEREGGNECSGIPHCQLLIGVLLT
jgi:hypothetical protein